MIPQLHCPTWPFFSYILRSPVIHFCSEIRVILFFRHDYTSSEQSVMSSLEQCSNHSITIISVHKYATSELEHRCSAVLV